ncbi:MAG: GNAT family protein [Coxiellaceae bacterium]|nr:GNAT family protein [Coxiellaceae bacterium]
MSINFDLPFPVLELNDELTLREHTTDDIKSFFDYYTNPNVAKHILATNPKSLTEAEAEIHYCRNLYRFKRGIYWSISRKKDNVMIGAVGITTNSFNRRGEIHYDLAENYWGKGITTAAIQKCVDYAFDTMGLKRIEAITVPENVASQKVLTKSCFKHEGTLRNYKFYNNQSMDIEMFAIIPEDRASK